METGGSVGATTSRPASTITLLIAALCKVSHLYYYRNLARLLLRIASLPKKFSKDSNQPSPHPCDIIYCEIDFVVSFHIHTTCKKKKKGNKAQTEVER